MFLDNGFTATGTVRLLGADISGQLNCNGGTFDNADGNALAADRATIKGSVFLNDGFTATGEVRLLGADISGQLNCNGGTFDNADADALSADGATIKGDVFLNDGFTATGTVRLLGARCNTLFWDDRCVTAVVSLEGATVEQLSDKWVHPIKSGSGARLSGFRYESFREGINDRLKTRLDWVRSSSGCTPQPYTQLAAVYRRAGHDERARKVLIEREVDRRKRGENPPGRQLRACSWGRRSLMGTSRPGRVVPRGAGVLRRRPIGGQPPRRAMVATKAAVTQPAQPSRTVNRPTALSCPADYPCFNPWVYSTETVIPLIKLDQTDNWTPAEGRTGTGCGYGQRPRWDGCSPPWPWPASPAFSKD